MSNDEENEIEKLKDDIISLKLSEASFDSNLTKLHNVIGTEDIPASLNLGKWWPIFNTESVAEKWLSDNIVEVIYEHLDEVMSVHDYEKLAHSVGEFSVCTIGATSLPYPHIQTDMFGNENTYYTLVYLKHNKICPFNGRIEGLDYQLDLPILNGSNQSILHRLNCLEAKVTTLEKKNRESRPSVDSLSMYLLMKLRSKNGRCGSVLLGMSNQIHFSEHDVLKDFKVEGECVNFEVVKNKNILFTFEIDGISLVSDFVINFYLNRDVNTAFGIKCVSKYIQLTYEQSSVSNYTEFSGKCTDIQMCNGARFVQILYDTSKEIFCGVFTCTNLSDEKTTVHKGDLIRIDKKFIYDWIEKKSRRIRIERMRKDVYEIKVRGMLVSVI